MEATLAGDRRAYEALLREVLPLLRQIARRRIADRAEAEDAVQDTLLAIHRLRASYDPARPLRPWVAAICERRCIDRLRARTRLAARLALAEPREEGPAAWDPHHGLACGELHAAIATLPRVQRLALTLAKLREMSLAEAAARTGLSPGALKVATHRALRSLRQRLRVEEEAPGLRPPAAGPRQMRWPGGAADAEAAAAR
jgi:RNA polymerase sigma-70 factor (ECF subfamily)